MDPQPYGWGSTGVAMLGDEDVGFFNGLGLRDLSFAALGDLWWELAGSVEV